MALQFMDGFDHYNLSQLGRKWNLSGTAHTSMALGRYGGQGLLRSTDGGGGHDTVYRAITPRTVVTVGHAFRVNAYGSNGGGEPLYFDDASGNIHTYLRFSTGGVLSALNVQSGATLATAATALATSRWYYLETSLTLGGGTSGSIVVRADGAILLSNTACATLNTAATATVGRIYVGSLGWNSVSYTYDDLYILDNQGSANNAPLGPVRVKTMYPYAAGDSAGWTPSGAASNYACVAESPADDDATYVSSSGGGALDLYLPGGVDADGQAIAGVQVNLTARMDDAGPHAISDEVKSAGTVYDGTVAAVTSAYATYSHVWESDPATGAAWTNAGLNASQLGSKAVS